MVKNESAPICGHSQIKLSTTTVWHILQKHQVAPVKKTRRFIKHKRGKRTVPGDRVQMDVTKIGSKIYQFTADDCAHFI